MLHFFAAGRDGLSRLQCAGDRPLVVAELERRKPLKKQRKRLRPMHHRLCDPTREGLGSQAADFDVTPAERVHVRQADQGARAKPFRHVALPRAPVRARVFLLRRGRAWSRTRTARQRELDAVLRRGLKTSTTIRVPPGCFSCSIPSRRRHGT